MENGKEIRLNTILFCILVAIGFAAFVFLGWSFCNWIDGYKDAGVRMSFGEFRRIYELAPSEWDRHCDYTYRREEWISPYDVRKEISGTYIRTSIAMITPFDFWRLLLWEKKCKRKYEREMHFKKKKASLKSLSIMIEKDADDVRKKLEEEEKKAEMLRQEIIDRLGGKE